MLLGRGRGYFTCGFSGVQQLLQINIVRVIYSINYLSFDKHTTHMSFVLPAIHVCRVCVRVCLNLAHSTPNYTSPSPSDKHHTHTHVRHHTRQTRDITFTTFVIVVGLCGVMFFLILFKFNLCGVSFISLLVRARNVDEESKKGRERENCHSHHESLFSIYSPILAVLEYRTLYTC